MNNTSRKIIITLGYAGFAAWLVNDLSKIIIQGHKDRNKIRADSEARIEAIDKAKKIVSEEIMAGHYGDESGIDLAMKDFHDLINLYAPKTE